MKDLNYYLRLPYTAVLRLDDEGDYVARVDELPGCSAHGKTPQEAFENLEEAKSLWLTDCIDSGDPIPEPVTEDSLPSGKWLQRVPRSLHLKLIKMAKREKVSLNQLVTSLLAEAVGLRRSADADTTTIMSGVLLGGHDNSWQTLFAEQQDAPWKISHHGGSYRLRSTVLDTLARLIPDNVTGELEVFEDAHEEERSARAHR